MKILLIKAERLSETEHWVTAPLGVLYLAAVARQRGHHAKVLDFRVHNEAELQKLLDLCHSESPDVIGLSALTHQARNAKHFTHVIRKKNPNAIIVLGGPLASSNAEYVLNNLPVDACITGEGERTFGDLFDAMETGNDWSSLPGIVRRTDSGNQANPPAAWIDPLDELPLPAWDQVDFDLYGRFLGLSLRLGRRAPVNASRGCPYGCTFCPSYFGRRSRGRSTEHLEQELLLLYNEHRIRRIEFIDETFNYDYDRACGILEMIRDRFPDLRISTFAGMRGDLIDEPFVRLLKEARCEFLPIAFETGSPRMQRAIRKKLDLEKAKNAATALAKAGIPSICYFMIGFPDETAEEVEETFALASSLRGGVAVFSVATPFPDTPLWESFYHGKKTPNPEELDAIFGYRANDAAIRDLEERALRLSRKGFLCNPRYWFILTNELHWRWTSNWRAVMWKLLAVIMPSRWKDKLAEKMDRRLGNTVG